MRFSPLAIILSICIFSVNMFKNRIDKYLVIYLKRDMWTLDKPMASLSAAIWGIPWMVILLNLVKSCFHCSNYVLQFKCYEGIAHVSACI